MINTQPAHALAQSLALPALCCSWTTTTTRMPPRSGSVPTAMRVCLWLHRLCLSADALLLVACHCLQQLTSHRKPEPACCPADYEDEDDDDDDE
jgi:hypothetical protein